MSGLMWAGASVAALLLLLGAVWSYGRWHWARLTTELKTSLETGRRDIQPRCYSERELEGLPAPLQRYFRAALTADMPLIAAATMEHFGTFNIGEKTDQWRPFNSKQFVVAQRPGFVWNGRVAMLPGLSVYVHDAYVAGEGLMHPTLAGVITLEDLRGGGAVAEGEMMRFLAEAPMYPTALLPSQNVRWEAVDDRSARATLTDGPNSTTLLFHFGDDDLIDSVRADARARTVGGKLVPTPWEGCWSNYQMQPRMRVPMSSDVGWLLPEGRKSYWRGTIKNLSYDFAG